MPGLRQRFKDWLKATGWRLIVDKHSRADVIAERGNERLIAEVKGYTAGSTGLDVNRSSYRSSSVGTCASRR
jgi:hypothetical protein